MQIQTIDKNSSFITPFTSPLSRSQKYSEQQQQYFAIQYLKHQINISEEKKIMPQILEKLDNLVSMNKIRIHEEEIIKADITVQILRKLAEIEVKLKILQNFKLEITKPME